MHQPEFYLHDRPFLQIFISLNIISMIPNSANIHFRESHFLIDKCLSRPYRAKSQYYCSETPLGSLMFTHVVLSCLASRKGRTCIGPIGHTKPLSKISTELNVSNTIFNQQIN